ncbi:hypothetical protein ACS0TY_031960 [Phlomoides rotata]
MYSAVCECYASFRNIVNFLVHGKREKEVIEYIFSEVDKHIEEDDLLSEYKLNALPNLYELFVRLVKYLTISQRTGIKLSSSSRTCWKL